MLCMKTMGEIVREWRTKRGIKSRAGLAQLVGTTRQNIDNLENDRVSEPTAPYIRRLAKLMGYGTVEELLDLKDPPALFEGIGVAEATGKGFLTIERQAFGVAEAQTLSYPLLRIPEKPMSWGQLKMLAELPDRFEVLLEDDAMAPDFPAGTVIRFRRGGDAKIGNRVLLRDAQGDLHFREYRQELNADGWAGHATGRGFATIRPGEHGARVVAIKTGHYVEGA